MLFLNPARKWEKRTTKYLRSHPEALELLRKADIGQLCVIELSSHLLDRENGDHHEFMCTLSVGDPIERTPSYRNVPWRLIMQDYSAEDASKILTDLCKSEVMEKYTPPKKDGLSTYFVLRGEHNIDSYKGLSLNPARRRILNNILKE